MEGQFTCGMGLAAHASLPSVLGDVMMAMAEVLAHHMTALDLADPDTRAEYEAYGTLVESYRTSAAQLQSIALHMAGSRDLPMGRHDQTVMTSEEGARRFADLVRHEEALVSVLDVQLTEHRRMLEGTG